MIIRTTISLLLFLCLAPLLSEVQAQETLPDSLRIVVLGSSTAAGAGASPKDSAWVWRYRAYLQSLNPAYEVHNLAVGGYTSYHIQATGYQPPEGRALPDSMHNITRALTFRPHAVIINLPSNDAALNFSIIEQSQNFERVADIAAQAQAALWVCTTQPRNLTEAKRLNLITMRDWITTRFGDRMLDFWSGLAAEDGSLLSQFDNGDGVHMNNSGHAILFERVRDARIPESLMQTSYAADLQPPSDLHLSIYPQPSRDIANFRIRNAAAGMLKLVVTDMLGRELKRVEQFVSPGETHHRISLGDLPRGMYHVIIRNGDRVTRGRILLSR